MSHNQDPATDPWNDLFEKIKKVVYLILVVGASVTAAALVLSGIATLFGY